MSSNAVTIPNLADNLTQFLGHVEKSLAAALQDEPGSGTEEGRGDTLMGAARHLCMGGSAKRARPLLVRLFADAVGAPEAPLVDVAVSAELIHSASLLHDDVVDAGMFRRGRPTVNARWGNIVAVMTGDMILSTALAKLAAIDPVLTQDAIKLVMEMTRAAIAEVEARADLTLPLDRLRFIAEGKTGALFGWCGLAAAKLAKNPAAGERFEAFGRRLGVAFQIADDVRDLTGTDEGKPQYADVQSKTPSLPILLAASRDENLRRKLKDAWAFSAMTPDRVKELGSIIQASGAIETSIERMNAEISAAIDALGPYANAAGGSQLVTWARMLGQNVRPRGTA
jgi:octaprenyl-diphosphate synthase